MINTPANTKIIEMSIERVNCSLSRTPHIVATMGIKYITIDAKTGDVSLIRT